MAITLDGSITGSAASGTTVNQTYTSTNATTTGALVVFALFNTNNPTANTLWFSAVIGGITYGLPLVISQTAGAPYMYMFALPVGVTSAGATFNVTGVWSGSNPTAIQILLFDGVDQLLPVTAGVADRATSGTSNTATLTTRVNDWAISSVGVPNAKTPSVDSGDTNDVDHSSGSTYRSYITHELASSTSTTVGCSWTGSATNAQVAAILQYDSGASPITYDNSTTFADAGGSSPFSFSHTINSATNSCVVLVIGVNTSNAISNVTINSQAMVVGPTISNSTLKSSLYWYTGLGSGTYTISFTVTNGASRPVAVATSFNRVHQTNPTLDLTGATAQGSATSLSAAVPTGIIGSVAVGGITTITSVATAFTGTIGDTIANQAQSSNLRAGMLYEMYMSGTTTTLGQRVAGSRAMALSCVALLPSLRSHHIIIPRNYQHIAVR